MLRIKFLPYEKAKKEDIKGMLNDLKSGMIIVIDAKLPAEEETKIIEETMKIVSEKFPGIELSSIEISHSKSETTLDKIKEVIIEKLSGKKRGLTIIGPAKIIRKIEKNPEELLLYT